MNKILIATAVLASTAFLAGCATDTPAPQETAASAQIIEDYKAEINSFFETSAVKAKAEGFITISEYTDGEGGIYISTYAYDPAQDASIEWMDGDGAKKQKGFQGLAYMTDISDLDVVDISLSGDTYTISHKVDGEIYSATVTVANDIVTSWSSYSGANKWIVTYGITEEMSKTIKDLEFVSDNF